MWRVRVRRLIAASLLVGLVACGQTARQSSPTTTSSSTTTTTTTTTTTSTTAPPAPTTSGPVPTSTTVAVPAGLRRGDSGPAVLALQRRLDALGYFSGELDATFGWSTHHAVVALQKVLGATRDGVVSSVVQDALDRGERPTARSTTGRVVEIDLVRQVLLVVDNGVVLVVLDTSTGRVRGTTPVGHWRISRQIDGLHRSPLGLLYRPKYFYRGVAIHGYTSVPPRPASHGCVRITYAAMDMVWARSLMPVGTAVWVY